ncbi:MAG: FHA domain-containing protein [Spirochaetales bacterium]|nr:FHA domain-containing protein [Spirochaetales bacterium]
MTESGKMGLYTAIGAVGGLAAFALVGLISLMKESFGSYLFFNIVMGASFGLAIGAVLGSAEGIVHGNKQKIIKGLLYGTLTGIAGGIVGVFLGQSLLMKFARTLGEVPLFMGALIQALCWMIMGMFVALGEGLRSRSGFKLTYGLLGGLTGGLLGGFILELLTSRFIGLIVLGASITFFYALMEKNFSRGVLRVLNGSMKGKKLALNQRKLTVGYGPGNDLALSGYDGVEEKCHAVITVKGDGVTVEPFSHRYDVFVNDEKTQKIRLKYEDVIRIGEARFLYEVK